MPQTMENLSHSTFQRTANSTVPEQIEAKIDNDPTISEWFTLRCQEGSECIRGNLLVLPMALGDDFSLLYAEPIYLRAEGIEFPELKQVILATGTTVVMRGSVSEAVAALIAESGEPDRIDDTPPTLPTDIPGSAVEEIDRAIEQLKESIRQLENALDRLTQGEQ